MDIQSPVSLSPNVIAKLGAARIREVILIAAVIPPRGKSAINRLAPPLVPLVRLAALTGIPIRLPAAVARFTFCNGMTRQQRRLAHLTFYPESSSVLVEPADRNEMPNEVPRTSIMTLRDRMLSTDRQRQCISALGGVENAHQMSE
ncbi:hypothetical protein JF781_24205 [Mycobacterium sp. WUMAC-067]|uniref:hypothetical protein n=1 Tax=unclassified Mycobacterium TaxID=2642494 RepID=UPI001CD9AD13|nr:MULTISPECIES: hypothetical protein [unclassified Mycobacterium]MCA2245450.1 hypothetical protein [Mycobacterium sp. WUMAC-067]MCA2316992.1 hypothetical protein [Mycobacterium sp. WUMAC-025]